MLISMPTGTSTIFGAFQAIPALLREGDVRRPGLKLLRIGKFASEIFRVKIDAALRDRGLFREGRSRSKAYQCFRGRTSMDMLLNDT
jgi:hypothetical protein